MTAEGREKLDLQFGGPFRQNYKNVILGEGVSGAPFHTVAGEGPVPGLRPRDLLPREGGFIARGQTDLRGLPRPHRVPQLRPPARRALRGVGGHERTGASTPDANCFLITEERW